MEKARSITVVCWTLTLTFIRAVELERSPYLINISFYDNNIYYFSLCYFFEENNDTYRTLSEENIKLQAEVMQYKVQRKKTTSSVLFRFNIAWKHW